MSISSALPSIARTKRRNSQEKSEIRLCSFCQKKPAAVLVQSSSSSSSIAANNNSVGSLTGKRKGEALCLLHYYSTSAVRAPTDNVSVINQAEIDLQLPDQQQLFAEAFVQLQRELQEESARAFAASSAAAADDPLAILHNLNNNNRKSKRKKPPPSSSSSAAVASIDLNNNKKTDTDAGGSGGGFMRQVPLPARLLRHQQNQALLQKEWIRKMQTNSRTDAAASRRKGSDISRRRRPSRKSIWNVVTKEEQLAAKKKRSKTAVGVDAQNSGKRNADQNEFYTNLHCCYGGGGGVVTCTCGSKKVECLMTNTSRNQEMAKGETWGMKDRGDEVVTRYRCNDCGKIWNEEE